MSDFEQTLQEARRLSGTPEGRQLAALCRQLGTPELQQALNRAAAGDLTQARQLLSALMQDPQAKQLLEQLGGSYGK